MRIDQPTDPDYECVCIQSVGFADTHETEGVSILRADDGRIFSMRAFSGEVAQLVAFYTAGKKDPVPSIYSMIREICDMSEMALVKVKIYEAGRALRANLYFKGRREVVLRNYRASDAMAMAAYNGVPILIRSNLLMDVN